MAEYPSLRLDRLSLHNRFQAIHQLATQQSIQPRVVELARIAYYLRDPKANHDLQKAAEWIISMGGIRLDGLNCYRLAGDFVALQAYYQQIPDLFASYQQARLRKMFNPHGLVDVYQQRRDQLELLQADFLAGQHQQFLARYKQYEELLGSQPFATWLRQLVELQTNPQPSVALTLAHELATAIRADRIEPWDDYGTINRWDLYELSCQLLDPPLSIDSTLIEPANNPAQRLLELLQAEQIAALEWSIYNNNDEADEGYCNYYLANGTTKPLSTGFVNQELERLVWDVVNFDWASEFPTQQPYGVFRLEVQQAQVVYLGMTWSSYDYEDLQSYANDEPSAIPYPVTQHPMNQDLYVMYLPEELRQAVDVARWNGAQRGY